MVQDSQAVVAGHLCLDIIPTLPAGVALPPPGQLAQIGPAFISTGGPVSNTGLALHILGVDTRLMGKVGNDPFGRTIFDLVRERGQRLADGIIVAPGETTSYTIVFNLSTRDRSFLHCPGANDTFRAIDVKLDTVRATRLFHFGYPPVMRCMYADGGWELSRLFQSVKALGATTSLDLAMTDPKGEAAAADWEGILRATLPYVDLFLPSIEELLFLVRPRDYRRMAAKGSVLDGVNPELLHRMSDLMIEWGVAIVGFKLGARGMYLRTAGEARLGRMGRGGPARAGEWAGRELWSPVFQLARFGGTTGSGDTTIAGLLAALLNGRSPEETLTFACAVGACCVERPDALSGLRSWDETWARIGAAWKRMSLKLDAPGWRLDRATRLWVAS